MCGRVGIFRPSTSGRRGGLLRHAEPLSLRHSCPIRAIQRSVQSCSNHRWRREVEQKESKDEDGNLVVEEKPTVKGGVLAWNMEDSEYMESLRQEIRETHGGKAPQVFDPSPAAGRSRWKQCGWDAILRLPTSTRWPGYCSRVHWSTRRGTQARSGAS